MKNSIAPLALLLCLTVISISRADDTSASGESAPRCTCSEPSEYARLGAYVAAGGGAAIRDFRAGGAGLDGRLGTVTGMDTASGSINMRAGYRLHPHVSGELMWEYQTGWDFRVNGDHADLAAWNLLANVKVNLTQSRWQPFVIAGIGLARRSTDSKVLLLDPKDGITRRVSSEEEAFVGRLGGGLDAYVTDAVSIGAEVAYVFGTGDLNALDYAVTSIVLAYHFF